jgi:hypothetical protein
VTKAEFEAYKEAASQTLSQLQEAISEPESAKLNKSAFEMSRQQISDALSDLSLRLRVLEDAL